LRAGALSPALRLELGLAPIAALAGTRMSNLASLHGMLPI